MFEFLKKNKVIDNSSVKKDDYMVSKLNDGGSYGVSYFITNYERLQINNWLKDVGVESISFSDILRMLDFDKDKKFNLYELIENTGTSAFVSGTVGGVVGAGVYGLTSPASATANSTITETIIKDSASSSSRKILGAMERSVMKTC